MEGDCCGDWSATTPFARALFSALMAGNDC
jgi:hypothetical protein